MTARYTIKNFNAQFPTEETCLDFLRDARWPNGIPCETCKKITKHYRVASRRSYSCEFCGNHVHPTANTIFHKSSTSLRSWFHAIFVMASTRCGISAKQLERELGVTYKTAWRMFTQIRKLMNEDIDPFTGHVEADETYMGGRRGGTPRGRPNAESHKTPVAGVVERGGKVLAQVVPDVKAKTLMPIIRAQVIPGTNTVFTDELSSYNGLSKTGYNHETVRHSAKVYVIGTAHTNSIEGYWSLVKRGIDGAHHFVSRKYLQSYLDEYSFRYNHRDDSAPMFSVLVNRVPVCVTVTAKAS